MSIEQERVYTPGPQLYLWYLGDPQTPRLVGDLTLVMNGRGVALQYSREWMTNGFALSEDLPLLPEARLPRQLDHAVGSVDDARPDRWGERVIRHLERPARTAVLDMLYFAGDERSGALGVSTHPDRYVPCPRAPLPQLRDVDALHQVVRAVLDGLPVDEHQRRLLAPGSLGGARPKALISLEGDAWILKFAEVGYLSEPLIEHAAMTLAAKTGIVVADTRVITLAAGHAVAVKRFDREAGRRHHVLSADVALGAAGSELSYPALAQLLRRRGDPTDGIALKQMRELFRRVVFNILIDNTDDHEKNHALLLVTDQQGRQHYRLTPAYDVLPAGLNLGYQAMMVGEHGTLSTVDNALSACMAYGLGYDDACQEAARVAAVVDHWAAHFAAIGVPQADVVALKAVIDRPDLLKQRQALRVFAPEHLNTSDESILEPD